MKVFISGSAENNIDNKYIEGAKEYSLFLVENDFDLIYGASNTGILRVVYETFKKHDRNIKAVTIERFKDDLKKICADEEIVSANTYKQYKKFYEADLMLFMPGGFGTFSELFFMLNAKRNNEVKCPIYIVNMFGYYNAVIKGLNKMYGEGFCNKRNVFYVIDNVEELKEALSKC